MPTKNIFPEDFFGTTNQKSDSSHPKIITHPLTCKANKKISYNIIEEENIEESIVESVQNSFVRGQYKNHPLLDLDNNDDQPSTSGSSQSNSNNVHQTPSDAEKQNFNVMWPLMNKNSGDIDNDEIFKETPHFVNFETEPAQKCREAKIKSHRPSSSNKLKPLPKTEVKEPKRKMTRPSTERGRSSNKRGAPIQAHLKQNSQNVNLPKLTPHAVIETELNKLLDIVPNNYMNDPEIKNKFNVLLQNICDIKQVIRKKNAKKELEIKNKPVIKPNKCVKKGMLLQPQKKHI